MIRMEESRQWQPDSLGGSDRSNLSSGQIGHFGGLQCVNDHENTKCIHLC